MAPTLDIELDCRWGVGPFPDAYDHGPVTVFDHPAADGADFYVCLDCGYLTADVRRFLHTECDRGANQINQSWRELIEQDGYPDG